MPSDKSHALAIVAKSAPGGALLKTLPERLSDEMEAVRRLESQAAARAIRIGGWLWQAKGALKHGEFKPWIAKHISAIRYRQCAYYMKLALVFVERSRVSEKAFATLLQPDFELVAKPADPTGALKALAKFIGDLSLNELLIKHGIKSVGLKAELTEGDAPRELSPGEQMELVWEQAYEPAKSLADLLIERGKDLPPEKREAIAAELNRALQALRAV